MISFADNFLAGSFLTLLMPVTLLIILTVWFVLTARRVPTDAPKSSSALPSAQVVAAAGAEAVNEITPADPSAPQV